MDESFTLDDIEQHEIEEAAQVPNTDNISVCYCRGICLRESGRNACPCKSINQYCSPVCHVGSAKCMNKRSVLEDLSESDSPQDAPEISDDDYIFEERGEQARTSRRGRRGRRRGRRGRRSRGTQRGDVGRGEERRDQRRRPGRGRGRGRGGLVAEENAEQRLVAHDNQLQNLVENLNLDVLQRLALELLRRQPAVFADLVNGEMNMHVQPQPGPEAPRPEAPPPQDDTPNWCNCGLCRIMPTQVENKCCCRRNMPCISTTPLFQQLVLDGNVLDIAMRYREDVLVLDHPRNNENFRHTAYRQYVL